MPDIFDQIAPSAGGAPVAKKDIFDQIAPGPSASQSETNASGLLSQIGNAFRPSVMMDTIEKTAASGLNAATGRPFANWLMPDKAQPPAFQPGQSIIPPELSNILKGLLGGTYQAPDITNQPPISSPGLSGVVDGSVDKVSSFLTPGTAALVPVATEGVAGSLVSTLIKALFGSQMAQGTYESGKQTVKDVQDPTKTRYDVGRDIGETAAQGAAVLGIAREGFREEPKMPGVDKNKVAQETTGTMAKALLPEEAAKTVPSARQSANPPVDTGVTQNRQYEIPPKLGIDPNVGGKAGRLNELKALGNKATPEQITERDALQGESDSVKARMQAQWFKGKEVTPDAKEEVQKNEGQVPSPDKAAPSGARLDEHYIGAVDSYGNVNAQKWDMAKSHEELGIKGKERWHYNSGYNEVQWWEEPSAEARHAVENFLEKKGQVVDSHIGIEGESYSQPDKQAPSLEEIKAKASPLGREDIDRLGLKPGVKAHEVIDNIAKDPQYFGHEDSALAGFLRDKFGPILKKTDVGLEAHPVSKSPAYDYGMTKMFVNAGRKDSGLIRDTLHEAAHAATSWQFRFPKTETQFKAVEDMEGHMETVKKALPAIESKFFKEVYEPAMAKGLDDQAKGANAAYADLQTKAKEAGVNFHTWSEVFYGLMNPREFIAKIFDSGQFRSYLDSVPAEGGSIWESVKNTVKNLLGIQRDSVLDRALDNLMAVGDEGEWGDRERFGMEGLDRSEPLGQEHEKGEEGKVKIPTINRLTGNNPTTASPSQAIFDVREEKEGKDSLIRKITQSRLSDEQTRSMIKSLGLDKAMPRSLEEAAYRLDVSRKAFSNWWKQREPKTSTIPAMANEADNRGRILARQFSNDVKDRLGEALGVKADKLEPVQKNALTFVIEAGGDKAKLADMKAKIDTRSEWWAKDAKRAIGYALTHGDKMRAVADYYERINKQQVRQENANGIQTLFRDNYVAHVQGLHDIDAILFEGGRKGVSSSYTHERTHETLADSIKAGIKPVSIDATELMEHRVSAGQRRINRAQMTQELGRMKDPASGKFIVQPTDIKKRVNGGVDVTVPPGYEKMFLGDDVVAVHKAYSGLLKSLSGESVFQGSTAGRALMTGAHTAKHVALLFDFYHPIRLWAYAAPLRGTKLAQSTGPAWLALDYNMGTLQRMASRGEIDPAMLPEILRKKQVGELAVKSGYNIGRIQDNLYSSLTEAIPGIGKYNKWLFDKYQRGLMLTTYDIEFQRQKTLLPKLSDQELSRKVSKELNIKFGNLGKESWVKSQTMQDLLRIIFLAPNWNEGLLRSELGAYTQVGDAIGRGVKARSFEEGGRRLLAGSLSRDMALLGVSIFLGNQALNYATRGKPTWENQENQPGAKISAWIPDTKALGGQGKSDGFFLNPLSLNAEISHQLIARAEKDKSVRAAVVDVLNNKESSIGQLAQLMATGQDWQGNHLSDWEAIKEGAKIMTPKPIQEPAIASAIEGKEQSPGAQQRSVMASLGLKTDPVRLSPSERVAREAGAPIEKLTLGERAKAQKSLAKDKPNASVRGIEMAIEHEAALAKQVKGALPDGISKWLDANKIKFGAYQESLREEGQNVVLTDKEKAREQELVVDEFSKRLKVLKNQVDADGSYTPARIQLRVNAILKAARQKVKSELRREIDNAAKNPTGQP